MLGYLEGGRLDTLINRSPQQYDAFMDRLAHTVKTVESSTRGRHPVVLGNGDLSEAELQEIVRLEHFDAIGLNLFTSSRRTQQLLERVRQATSLPVIFSEIGAPAAPGDLQEETRQARDVYDRLVVWRDNRAGRSRTGIAVGVFIYEWSDEVWRSAETGVPQDGRFGIAGKPAFKTLIKTLEEFQPFRPQSNSPRDLLEVAFAYLDAKDFWRTTVYTQRLIDRYSRAAGAQQAHVRRLKAQGKQVSDADTLWALNAVGTAYFLKGRAYYEWGDKARAKETFDALVNRYPSAYLRDASGRQWLLEDHVEVRVDRKRWNPLSRKSSHWFVAEIRPSPGRHRVEIRAQNAAGEMLTVQQVVVRVTDDAREPRYAVSLIPSQPTFSVEDEIAMEVVVTDSHGQPQVRQWVDYGFFLPVGWQEEFGRVMTDRNGTAWLRLRRKPHPQTEYLIAAASCPFLQRGPRRSEAALVFVRLTAPEVYDTKRTSAAFAVYRNHGYPGNHYAPSGWTGDHEDLEYDDNVVRHPHSPPTCIRIRYRAEGRQGRGWAGIFWQDPPNNWGTLPGGFRLTGKKKLTVWARGETGGEHIVEFGIGGIGGDYPDSTSASIGPLTLTRDWQPYSIDLTGRDLRSLISGFHVVVTQRGNPEGCTFYLDDIEFE